MFWQLLSVIARERVVFLLGGFYFIYLFIYLFVVGSISFSSSSLALVLSTVKPSCCAEGDTSCTGAAGGMPLPLRLLQGPQLFAPQSY